MEKNSVFREFIGYFISGFAGGFIYGILSTHIETISFWYGLIGAISLTLSMIPIYICKNRIVKSLIFGFSFGISVSFLSYFLLNRNERFLGYTFPIICGCFVGGFLYIYFLPLREKN